MAEDQDGPDFSAGAWQDGNPEIDWLGPRGLPVADSEDLTRILNLPRRPVVTEGSPTAEAMIAMAMQKYSLGPRACNCAKLDEQIAAGNRKCITTPLWIQAWMLYEIELIGGLLANVVVGGGKTLVGLLAPLALRDCRLALLLIPASLVDQIIAEYQLIAEHFRVPGLSVHMPGGRTWKRAPEPRSAQHGGGDEPMLHVLPYTGLSSPKRSGWIENLRPDVIIADEVDSLSDRTSARTLRLLRHYQQFWRTTRFLGWTGSLTDKSLTEFDHLAGLALREGSPMPLNHEVTKDMGRCLDAVPNPCPPGALIRLLEVGEGVDRVRHAFQRRLAETPGFIAVGGRQRIIAPTSGQEVGLSIRVRPAPEIPQIVNDALGKVRSSVRPDSLGRKGPDDVVEDEILTDPMEQARCAREVASGMFYKWRFPPVRLDQHGRLVIDKARGAPQQRETIERWYAARKAWNSEINSKRLRGDLNLDSPKLCEDAARRAWGDLPADSNLPDWRADNWPDWRDVMDTVVYETEAVRLDPFLVDDAIRWALERPGIVWYGMTEFAEWMQERARQHFGVELPVFDGGTGKEIVKEIGNRSIIASIKSHGRGRDKLQFAFNRQLIAQMLSSSRQMEQLLGRLHRRGQDAVTIETSIYTHTPEVHSAFDQALTRAEYVKQLTNSEQKLLDGWECE